MYAVVQENLKEPIIFPRYRDAKSKFEELVKNEPNKKAGVFLVGSDSATHWHFGNFCT